jgi:hypothetical protein
LIIFLPFIVQATFIVIYSLSGLGGRQFDNPLVTGAEDFKCPAASRSSRFNLLHGHQA